MKTLYFVRGPASSEQKALADKANARIRNVAAYHDGDYVEKCDSVLGEIPAAYEHFSLNEHQVDAIALINGVGGTGVSQEIPRRRGRPPKRMPQALDE